MIRLYEEVVMEFARIFKFNPNHDKRGLFTTSSGDRVGDEVTMLMKDKKWVYSDGEKVSADAEKRLKALRVPPAWKDVQLNEDENAALQAIGKDAKGRLQYRYSAEHSEAAAAAKFARVKEFTGDAPLLRQSIAKDVLSKDHDTKEAASALSLIDKTGFRVGSDRDTGADKLAFGASTLEARHVKIKGDTIKFNFTGKKGVTINKTLRDSELAKMLAPRVSGGGKTKLFDTTDRKIRSYLEGISGGKYEVKDFRTYHGTAVALRELKKYSIPSSEKDFKKQQREVSKVVAEHLGNTPAVALKSYIDPSVWKQWKPKK